MESDKEALRGKAARAADGAVAYTKFLTPAERAFLDGLTKSYDIQIRFDGGYPDAERTVAEIAPSGEQEGEWALCSALFARHGKFASPLSHRDYLGAVLALGINRECVGDIVVGTKGTHIFVLNEMASFVMDNLTEIGREPVSLEYAESAPEHSDDGIAVKGTVASLRLDSIISTGLNLPRGKACDLVAQNRVSLNWQEALKPSAEIHVGDTVSIRGVGRVRLESVGGLSRKGRLGVILKVYKS